MQYTTIRCEQCGGSIMRWCYSPPPAPAEHRCLQCGRDWPRAETEAAQQQQAEIEMTLRLDAFTQALGGALAGETLRVDAAGGVAIGQQLALL